ncbi:MAG: hypothetical protein OMM_05931 [Candidatus Magnetoglobus multicellularis str. Araruama]|uniref:Toprim domain-containing protein n=1 Tax=Candidatus Magnetoglobus multicellularis str. Araruama TaxID=890399 RepID=A0A1V1NT62_9BACT|nr:MAG: hypothetical protein OMM_05931 [Candidatus Magnetoglobus multicellularis str. Araruama]
MCSPFRAKVRDDHILIPQSAETKIRDCIVNYYHEKFLNNPQALKYQTQTRCHNIETLKYLKIGFTDGCMHQYLTAKGYSLDEQLNTGLVVKKDGKIRDYFHKGLYIYPHKTLDGDYGHFTIKDSNKKYSYQLPNEYKNDGCVFYNMPVLKKSDEIFIVEGENDVTSLIEAGQKKGDCYQWANIQKTNRLLAQLDKKGQ